MSEGENHLSEQEARLTAKAVKPLVDAEAAADLAMKDFAKKATDEALSEAQRVYPTTRDAEPESRLDEQKAEVVAWGAKPAIDQAAESQVQHDEANERFVRQIVQLNDDFDYSQTQEYKHAEAEERAASEKAEKDSANADAVVDTLDKSYDTPEGK